MDVFHGEALSSTRHSDDENSPRGPPRWTEVPRRSRRHTAEVLSTSNVNMSSIPLSNLHRRQSRDNGSESGGKPPAYEPTEQEEPLLDQDDSSSLDTPTERNYYEKQNAARNCWPGQKYLMIGSVTVLFFFVLFAIAAFLSLPLHKRPVYNFQPEVSDGSLGILLHPDYHEYRESGELRYTWNITSEERAPDGVLKKVYLINGQFPGPLIECRPGDQLHIHVTNGLSNPDESISIHWHGLSLRGANEMDGASAFTQCPIPPGKSFLYSFNIEEDSVGTFWYHAHSDVQRGDGMYGGLVVHDRHERVRELSRHFYEKEVLLLIGDWYHRDARQVLDWYMSVRGFKNEPAPDSLLVNGAGKFPCSRALPARPVKCLDKWKDKTPGLFRPDLIDTPIRLRVVNVGSLTGFTLGVSSGSLTPITIDGSHPIVGSPSDSVGILHPGERVDMVLEWDKDSPREDMRLRVSLDEEKLRYSNDALMQHQFFPFITSRSIDNTILMGAWELASESQRSQFALELTTGSRTPADQPFQVPPEVDQTILLYVKTEQRSQFGNRPMGFINRTSWAAQALPPLPLRQLPRESWDANQLVPFIRWREPKPLWVDIIINNLDDDSHPFHLHGHSFYVVASHQAEHGWGSYSPYAKSGDASMKPHINRAGPLKKDTVNVPKKGYVVLRFQADNPGIWMFHCHVLFHMASGMTMGLFVGADEKRTPIDPNQGDLCL